MYALIHIRRESGYVRKIAIRCRDIDKGKVTVTGPGTRKLSVAAFIVSYRHLVLASEIVAFAHRRI